MAAVEELMAAGDTGIDDDTKAKIEAHASKCHRTKIGKVLWLRMIYSNAQNVSYTMELNGMDESDSVASRQTISQHFLAVPNR